MIKENKIAFTKKLITQFSMPIFAVDMIKDWHETTDSFFIQEKVFEIQMSIEDIIQCLCTPEKEAPAYSIRFDEL